MTKRKVKSEYSPLLFYSIYMNYFHVFPQTLPKCLNVQYFWWIKVSKALIKPS